MQKIILFYKFVPVADPEAVRLWQKALAEKLNLRGRIIIAPHGINGTLGGNLDDLKTYVKEFKNFMPFKGTAFKWSEGSREDFPKLSVKVRDEVVTFQATDELVVNEQGVVGGGKHLKPEQVHELVKERGDEVVFSMAVTLTKRRWENSKMPWCRMCVPLKTLFRNLKAANTTNLKTSRS